MNLVLVKAGTEFDGQPEIVDLSGDPLSDANEEHVNVNEERGL